MDKITQVFKGKLLRVSTKETTLPNGHRIRLEMITHPGAALIVPFLNSRTVIFLRQLRPVIKSYLYELPAGTLGKGEAPLACARREIVEETGYTAKKFTRLGAIVPVPGYSTEKIIIYKAENLHFGGYHPEPDEIIRTLTLSKAEVARLFKSGKIIDAKTIAALAFCGWL